MNAAFLLVALYGSTHKFVPRPQDENKPTQVRISFGEDPMRMMRIMWQTKTATKSRVVEYGETPELGMMATGIQPTYQYQTGALAEVLLYNLKPSTTYYYRVGDKQGGWSEPSKFRTAELNPSEFTFTAYGDHGVTADAVKNVQNTLDEKPAFHLLLGDVSYANGTQSTWDEYFDEIEPMTKSIPFMMTLGNHENETMKIEGKDVRIGYVSALARFASPGNEQWYTFDYGNVRFVAFNSDDYQNPTQLEWLDKTLAVAREDKSIKWLIVFQHHPLYGTSKGRGDNQGLIKAVGPIFDRYKVDVVLCGHDHHYERQYPMRDGAIISKDPSSYKRGAGTLYIIEGGGGKSVYDFTDPAPEKCAKREHATGYLRVTVRKSGPLVIEAKRIDKSLIERIEIRE